LGDGHGEPVAKKGPTASGVAGIALALGAAAAQELGAPQWVWIVAAGVAGVLLAWSLVLLVRAWTLESAAAVIRNEIARTSGVSAEPAREDQLRKGLLAAMRGIQSELRRNRSDLNHHSRWAYPEPGFTFALDEWEDRRAFLAEQPEAADVWESVTDAYQRLERLNAWLTSEERARKRTPEDLNAPEVVQAIDRADNALSAKLEELANRN
jgi:hypothetical protein